MKGNGHDIHELTRVEAYLLSEKAGHPWHMHDYFWSQAEAIVLQRVTIVDMAVKVAGKKSAKPKSATAVKSPGTTKNLLAAARKKAPEPQLPLGDEAPTTKPVAATKSKSTNPAKKKAFPASGKSVAKLK